MKSHRVSGTARQTAQAQFSAFATPLVNDAISRAVGIEIDAGADALHKLRVALRRLRTLLWAYRPLLDKEFDDQQRAFLKFLAETAGKTRDWDIVIELMGELRGNERAPLDDLRLVRGKALDTSRETLAQARTSSPHCATRSGRRTPSSTPLMSAWRCPNSRAGV
jgi:CHAD domain-containing protein